MIVFGLVLVAYIIAEINKPQAVDWSVTLSKEDKNPYGGYILYRQLKNIFPKATIESHRTPVYNQLNNYNGTSSAYLLINRTLNLSANDFEEMKNYVAPGNYVFASASNFKKLLIDSLGFKTFSRVSLLKEDSTSVNFVNPSLKSAGSYPFKKSTIDEYFTKIDTAKSIILGVNNLADPNFIKINYGGDISAAHVETPHGLPQRHSSPYRALAVSKPCRQQITQPHSLWLGLCLIHRYRRK